MNLISAPAPNRASLSVDSTPATSPMTASRLADLCPTGQPIDARLILSQHPELKGEKAAVIDLAYEEYCQQLERGAPPDLDEFCARFPFQSSLRRLLDVDAFFQENQRLLVDDQPISWPELGQSFLGFVLKCELGRGAFARVYLATETALGKRLVAVKISRQGAAEADTLGRLQHPNIVPVHSIKFDPESGLTVICMPYLGSATLQDILDHFALNAALPTLGQGLLEAIRATTPVEAAAAQSDVTSAFERSSYIDEVLRIGIALAEALDFVHSQGVCHLDLKPSNVLLSLNGQPRLLDFNLSSDRPAAALRTGGTLPYMSPEQLLATLSTNTADSPVVDSKTDLFALGIVLYELLSRQHPFGPIPTKVSLEELQAFLIEHHRKGPRPLRQANPAVDERLAHLVERCLKWDPKLRPQSATEIATALRNCLPAMPQPDRKVARHSWRLRAAALSLLLTGVAGASFLSFRDTPKVISPVATAQANKSPEGDLKSPQALFDRGRAQLRQGDPMLALLDFRAASADDRDGKIPACAGYCLCALKQYSDAVVSFQIGIDAGFKTAEAFNDLGYAYLELGKYDEALVALDRAVAHDTGLQAAYHNRALIHLQFALNRKGKGADAGIADIDKAIAAGPASAELYRDAASLHALGGKSKSALEYLRQAIDLGLDPRKLPSDISFKQLRDLVEFQDLARRPVLAIPVTKAVRLLDPIKASR